MGRRQQKDRQEKKVWRLGLYLRLSKEDQDKMAGAAFSESIENQDKILGEFIHTLKVRYPDESFQVAGVFIDDGLTGTSVDKRDEFLKMIDAIEKGRINCVLLKDLSRLFRNHTEQSYFLELFCPMHNTRVIAVNNNIDTYINPDIVYGYDVTLTGLSNDRYCYTISKNICQTFQMKRRRGEFIGAFAPYGYKKERENKNHLVIDEEAGKVVKDIFSWYASGQYAKTAIAAKLNGLGVPSPALYKREKGLKYYNPKLKHNKPLWSFKTIDTILHNEIYRGNMIQGKTEKLSYKIDRYVKKEKKDWVVVENTHEPIIDKDTFDKVESLLNKDVKVKSTERGKGEYNLFAGLIRCADCGRAMHRKQNKNSSYGYFLCRTYTDISKNGCTSRHTIKDFQVEQAVLKAIQVQVQFLDNLNEILADSDEMPVNKKKYTLSHTYKKAAEEVKTTEKIMDHLYMDFRKNLISEIQYFRLRKELEENLVHQEEVLNNLDGFCEEGKEKKEPKSIALLKKYRNFTRLDRLLVLELADSILIHEDKTIEVVFKVQDQLLAQAKNL